MTGTMNTGTLITGQHYIGGCWHGQPQAGTCSFNPALNQPLRWTFAEAGSMELQQVTELAESAAMPYRLSSRQQRADFLEQIAANIEAMGEVLIETVMAETALPKGRVEGERGRTCNQLRLFARLLRSPQEEVHEQAEPDRQPVPKPELRLRTVALGPVVVFGASNFPLAFSVAGGDTASALAAGCPVIVKAHNAHPATSELVARAIAKAIEQCQMPMGVFALVHARTHAFSEQLIQHPAIKAVAFTGSEQVGMHFQRLIWQRKEPIPFYGELGSQNPLCVLPAYLQQHSEAFAGQLFNSVVMGQGQFCTRPGLVFLLRDSASDALKAQLQALCQPHPASAMLTAKIAASYRQQVETLQQSAGVTLLAEGQGEEEGCVTKARIFCTNARTFVEQPLLREEVFGPATLLIECNDITELQMLLTTLAGQLTATLYANYSEQASVRSLLQALEQKAGRVIVGQMPTGVEVCASMNHGGPFPAASDSRYTAVGSRAIQRFVRPVCYQNVPAWYFE